MSEAFLCDVLCCVILVLSESDMSYLKEKVFGLESFYVTGEERRCWPKALLFQGNVRGRQLEDSMTIIEERLRSAPNGK